MARKRREWGGRNPKLCELTIELTIGGGFGRPWAGQGNEIIRKNADLGRKNDSVQDCKTSIPGSNPGGASKLP